MNCTLKVGELLKLMSIVIAWITITFSTTYAQNYILLDDAAGFQDDASVEELDAYSGLILQNHGAVLGDLKVYSYAFYVHDESKANWSVTTSMDRARELVGATGAQYYLIIGKSSGPNSICRDFHVSLNMPNIYNGCFPPTASGLLAREIENAIKVAYSGNYNEYELAEIVGLNVFNSFLEDAEVCCPDPNIDCNTFCSTTPPPTPDELMDHKETIIAPMTIPEPIADKRGLRIGNIYDLYGLEDPVDLFSSVFQYSGSDQIVVVTDQYSECEGSTLVEDLIESNESSILWLNIQVVNNGSNVQYEEFIYIGGNIRTGLLDYEGNAAWAANEICTQTKLKVKEVRQGGITFTDNNRKTASPSPSYWGPVQDLDTRLPEYESWFLRDGIAALNMFEILEDLLDIFLGSGDGVTTVRPEWWTAEPCDNILWDWPGTYIATFEVLAKFLGDFKELYDFFIQDMWNIDWSELVESILDIDIIEYGRNIGEKYINSVETCVFNFCECGASGIPPLWDYNQVGTWFDLIANDEGYQYCNSVFIYKGALVGIEIVTGAKSIPKLFKSAKNFIKSKKFGAVAKGLNPVKFYENVSQKLGENYNKWRQIKGELDEISSNGVRWNLFYEQEFLVLVFKNPFIQNIYKNVMIRLPDATHTEFWEEFKKVFNTIGDSPPDFEGIKKGVVYFMDINEAPVEFANWFKTNSKGVKAWDGLKKFNKLRVNTEVLGHTIDWGDDLFRRFERVELKNPSFYDEVDEFPVVAKYFGEGYPIIKKNIPTNKEVELDMYSLDRARPERNGGNPIFDTGDPPAYKINTTKVKYDNIHNNIDQPSGKIRDNDGNIIHTDNVNGEGLMYAVDEAGNIHIGTRGGMANSFPHPTLLGGTNPNVQCAGMIKFNQGRILEINNSSGHFKPSGVHLQQVESVFQSKFPPNSFDTNFSFVNVAQ